MFLDTSGLLCILRAHEHHHPLACELFDAAPKRLTHNLVLAELIPLAQVRGVSRQLTLDFFDAILADDRIEVIYAEEVDFLNANQLLRKRLDKTYSLCDAWSFVLMRERGETEALTTDQHFEQEGFVRLLKD